MWNIKYNWLSVFPENMLVFVLKLWAAWLHDNDMLQSAVSVIMSNNSVSIETILYYSLIPMEACLRHGIKNKI